MQAQTPEQVIELVSGALSAGDLDGAVSLYEPDAVFMAEPGSPVAGRDEIRPALARFLALRPKLTGTIRSVVAVGDVALVRNDWSLEGAGPDGPVQMQGRSLDLVRRQDDGRWLVVVDDPWGGA